MQSKEEKGSRYPEALEIGSIASEGQRDMGKRCIGPPLTAGPCGHPADNLSGREVEVLACVARGHTNSKIGALLGIAAETVKAHLRSASRKLGASNRTEAVMIAMKRGLLEL